MKVISWNCHQSFRTKAERVLALKPDLLVLPECEEPSKLSAKGVHFHDAYWVGKNKHKGLGILTFNGWNIEALEEVSPRIPYVIPVRIQKEDFSFILWAVWSQKPMSHSNYGVRMWKALSSYSAHLSEDRIIIAGDFNSSSIWDREGRESNHSNIVSELELNGIKSLYHEYWKEQQGSETSPTLLFTYNVEKPFHIDYCFASNWFVQRLTSMTVGEANAWLELSDHMPLEVDFQLD
jgi:exonuclease III